MSKKKSTAAQPQFDANDVRIYMGPTLHRRVLVHASCFRGGLSSAAEDVIKRCPEVAKLIVSVDETAATKRKIAEPGTEQHRVNEYLKTVRFGGNGEVRA